VDRDAGPARGRAGTGAPPLMERYAGRYGLLKQLGRGGMGEVSLAVDLNTGAEYALKRLNLRGTGLGGNLLRAEFEALARVRHPAIVRVVEFGFDFEDSPFLVMEHVPGWPADQVVRPGAWDALAIVASRIVAGLEALHAAGIVHGDLKPGNVLVGPLGDDGRPRDVRLVDFGLAALVERDAEGHRGTPGYTAPEVVAGGAPTPAADLYALGATLFALAAGRPPFEGADVGTTLSRQLAGPPSALPLEEAGVAPGWIRLILQLMATAPAERPRGAADVRRAIDSIAPAARLSLSERLSAQTLIGRDRELARLERVWRSTAKGARSLLLTGESGIGKSALLDAFAVRGTLAGRSVIRVSGAVSGEPAAAWRVVVRRVAAEARVDWTTLPAELRAVLEDHASAPDEPALAAIAARLAEWVRKLALPDGGPCILLDDADALDAASLRALRRSMLEGDSAPALWVLARRNEAGSVSDEERLLISAGASELLALEPLDREAVTRLAASRLGAEPPAEFVEFLWHRAAGHAGLTVEAMRAAADAGVLHDEELGIRVDAEGLAALPALADFEATRLRRLATLGEEPTRAARVLAVRAVPMELESLRRIDAGISAAALSALQAQGLAARDHEGRWSLVPPAMAARLLESVSADDVRAIHAAILAAGDLSPHEAFVHRRGVGDREGALEAAEQAFAESGEPLLATDAAALAAPQDVGVAARWLERAARAWMDRGRYANAAPLVERALEIDSDPSARPDRWGMLTTCHIRNGNLDGVATAAAAAKREQLTDAAMALIRTNEAARLSALGKNDEALAVAREAVAFGEKSGSASALGTARQTEGMSLLYLGRMEEALNLAESVAGSFSNSGNLLGELRARMLRAHLVALMGRPAEAESLFRAILESARQHHVRLIIEEVSAGHSQILVTLGRWTEARQAQAEALRISLEDARPFHVANGMANLALIDGLMGTLDHARREVPRSYWLCRKHSPRDLAGVLRARAQVSLARGRTSEARHWAERAAARARRDALPDQVDWSVLEMLRAASREGDWGTVAGLAEGRLRRKSRAGSVADVALSVAAGRAAIRIGPLEAAVDRLAAIDAWPASASGAYASALKEQLRAEIALLKSGSQQPASLGDHCLELLAALPAVPDRAAAALEMARLALEHRPDVGEAIRRWLEVAIADFERLGDRRGREQALLLSLRWYRDHFVPRALPAREQDLLEAVGRLLESMSEVTALLQRAMRMAVEQFEAERGLLFLIEPETRQLEIRAEHGNMDPTSRRDAATYSSRAVERVTQSGDSLLIEDTEASPTGASPSMKRLGLGSIMCVPLFRAGRVIGAVYVDHPRRGAFHRDDRKLLEGFAHLMAIAIERSLGEEEVRRANEALVGENLSLRQEVESRYHPSGVIGTSAAMMRVFAVVERAAQVNSTVLLTGENGTGKEKLARVLHHSGKRKGGPFVTVNCGAIPETLLESELFGILPRVASDVGGRDGRFVEANGGTLFLDEIGEMPPKAQVALLSVLTNREVTPVGSGRPIPVDVRVIAATNQDLRRRIDEGQFRLDLFFRLNVIPIEVPPLRERKADIPALARFFAEHFARLQERPVPKLSPEFVAALMQSDWPGNVRELQNYVERVMAMTPEGTLYPLRQPGDNAQNPRARSTPGKGSLADQLADLERRILILAMERASGNQSLAARDLGMTEQTLRYRLKKHGLASSRRISRTRNKRRKP